MSLDIRASQLAMLPLKCCFLCCGLALPFDGNSLHASFSAPCCVKDETVLLQVEGALLKRIPEVKQILPFHSSVANTS